jgi:uncharacterized protein (TIGR02147 family)
MENQFTLPTPFDYLDYRRYLADYFSACRMGDSKFSLRAFAHRAGLPLSNSGLFNKLIAGKRNLTLDLRVKLAKALKLGSEEARYFDLLVQFNQSRDGEGQQYFYAQMAKFRKSKARVIKRDGYDYYSRWHYSIVRAFFGINGKEKNPAAIGQKIFPQLSTHEVEDSIRLLVKMGLVTKTANGYTLTDKHIATERENRDFVGKLRIQEMIRLSQEVFNHIPHGDREYSAMTMYISKQGYQILSERIRAFREEFKTLVSADQDEDRIYTLAIQFFPNNILPEWGTGAAPRKP